jgi:hypothetical protein
MSSTPGFQNSQQVYGALGVSTPTNWPIIASRDPNLNDINYKIGTFWVNKIGRTLWYLNTQSTIGGSLTSVWIDIVSAVFNLKDTDGNIVTPVSGEIEITGYPNSTSTSNIGVKTIAGTPGILQISNLDSITPYVVGSNPNLSQFTTIQSAIDAAVLDGASINTPKIVSITAGTYLENLTLAPYVFLSGIVDGSNNTSLIIGNAIYDGVGNWGATNISFTSLNASAALSIQGIDAGNVYLQSTQFITTVGIGLEITSSGKSVNLSLCTINADNNALGINVIDGRIAIFGCSINSINESCINLISPAFCIILNSILISSNIYIIKGDGFLSYGDIACGGASSAIQTTINSTGFSTLAGRLSFDGGQTFLTAKGSIWAGNNFNVSVVPVGADGTVLVADSTQTAGVRWSNYNDAFQNNLNTLSNAFQTITTIVVDNGTSIVLEGTMIASNVGHTDITGGDLVVIADGTAAALVGSPVVNVQASTTGTFQTIFSGNTLLVQVRAPTADSYDWRFTYSYTTLP